MIYKLTFEDGRIDWCTAKDELHLLKSYDADYDLPLQEIETLEEVTDQYAQSIMVTNDDGEQTSLYDLVISDDFQIIASNEFL
jgi:hypothetical protein